MCNHFCREEAYNPNPMPNKEGVFTEETWVLSCQGWKHPISLNVLTTTETWSVMFFIVSSQSNNISNGSLIIQEVQLILEKWERNCLLYTTEE